MNRRFRHARWMQLALSAVLLATGTDLAAGSARADSPELITGAPVPAEELAQILYPVRTRGIVMQEPKATSFGFPIQFEFDSARVKAESRAYLDEVGKMMNLRRMAGKTVEIVGHADASGAEGYNLALSEQRARAVRQYLARYHGVALERLSVVGRGESEPIDPSDPYAARNRRVQFQAVN